MRTPAKQYLEEYRQSFVMIERRCRKQCDSWLDIVKELHIDRGSLLGSEQFGSLSGVERADALHEIDSRITLCYTTINDLHARKEKELVVKRGYRRRCSRIRLQVSRLSDEALERGWKWNND